MELRESSGEFVRGTTWVFEDGSQVQTHAHRHTYIYVCANLSYPFCVPVVFETILNLLCPRGVFPIKQVILRADEKANEGGKEDDSSFYDEFEKTTKGEDA